jgi:hypothetical protein
VTSRKKNLFLVQLTIFFVAIALLYNTYRDKNKDSEIFVEAKIETNPNVNSFTDIEYSGFDLTGNRYILTALKAKFKTESPELVDMKGVEGKFYLKDGTVLVVISDEGLYNNVTLDMNFRKNVKANYLSHILFSDLLSYSNSNAKLIATGNVRGDSIEKGEFVADNVEYDLLGKNLNFSMFGKERVNIKLKN